MSMTFNKLSRPFFVFLTVMLFAAQPMLFAQDDSEQAEPIQVESEEKPFKAGEMIIEHILDAHEIHLIGDLVIYLPVIVYTDQSMKMFSSSKFYHSEHPFVDNEGEDRVYYEHDGLVMYKERIYASANGGGIAMDAETGEITNSTILDFSITKTVVGLFFTGIIVFFLFFAVARGYKKRKDSAPKGIQSFMEPLILFIRDEVVVPSIGAKKADRYMPFLLTIFFFIWIANVLGLIPFLGGFNVTGTLSVTIVLAGIVFLVTTFSGNKNYWGHILWPPGVPFLIKLILVPIEFLGIFIKPLVLMIRLTANITAGHIIMLAFVALIFIFGNSMGDAVGHGVGVGSVLFMVFMFFLELLVAFLQAYVFTLLAALYIGDATQEAHT